MTKIKEIIWLAQFVEKIESKHGVSIDEVEEAFACRPRIQRFERGDVRGEDLYRLLGRTDSRRRIAVYFVLKARGRALVISARDMTAGEKESMAKSRVKAKPQKRVPLPEHFASLQEAGSFWDTHDSADYEEYVSEAECVAEIKRRTYLVPLDSNLYRMVRTIAHQKGISPETLVNMWIQEKAS